MPLDDTATTIARWAPYLLAVGVVALGVLFYLALRTRSPEAPDDHDSRRDAGELIEVAARLESQLDTKAERLETLVEEARRLVDQLERHAAASRAAPGAGAGDPLSRSVHELADQGLSSVEIAQRLDEPVGKIELVLALRDQRQRG